MREAAYKALADVGRDSMHFRPPEEQNDHKITCGVRANVLAQVSSSLPLTLLQKGCYTLQLPGLDPDSLVLVGSAARTAQATASVSRWCFSLLHSRQKTPVGLLCR